MDLYQRTLKDFFSMSGIGLHSGKKVTIKAYPAPVDHGIVFKRVDLKESVSIPAKIKHVQISELSTTLVKGSARVSTIEHLMAALYAHGINNILITLNAGEVPILDGSAKAYVEAISSVGTREQEKLQKVFAPQKEISLSHEGREIKFEPHNEKTLIIDYTTDYPDNPVIAKQQFIMNVSEQSFKEICSARTFCLLKDVKYMQERGLALGGSLENAIVVDDHKIMNEGGLRLEKEFVKHKILDCIGDLSLLGQTIYGKIIVYKGGHSLHHELTKNLSLLN